MNLIEQLLLDRRSADAATRARRLEQRADALTVQLGNRVAQMCHTWHLFVARIGEITARYLGAAFQQVPRHRGPCKQIPVAPLPTKMRHGRAHR